MAEPPPPITGHIVRLPNAAPHRTLRLMTDVDLLLAATVASVRMNPPAIVFEPPASLGRVRRVPEGLRGRQEGHRRRGRDREVDGVGGEAVKDEAVLVCTEHAGARSSACSHRRPCTTDARRSAPSRPSTDGRRQRRGC
jgi:hypothetical protein